ncbi:MAG: HDOD domain-containing protein [Thermodesulfobacteriota bacterium]
MNTNPPSPAYNALQRVINADPSFPAFTANIQELLSIQDNPYKTVNAVSSIILRDLSLTTQILKIVNSIFFQTYQRQVHTVSNAVMVLGFDRIRDLAVGLRLFEHFNQSPSLSHLKQLIVLSFLTAIEAQELTEDAPNLKAEEVFITALLFNIGELIVAYYLPEQYRRILDRQEKGEAKSEAAQKVLMASMEELGLATLRDWNLPDSMVKRLSYLHSAGASSVGPEGRLRKMIKGAFDLSKNLLDPHIEPEERQQKEEKVCKNLGLNPQNLTQSITASKKRLHEMTTVLRIDLRQMEISEALRLKDVREDKAAVASPPSAEPLPPSAEPAFKGSEPAALRSSEPAVVQSAEAAVSPSAGPATPQSAGPADLQSAETVVSQAGQPPETAARAADSQSEDLKKLQFLYQVMEEVNQALVSQAPINQVLLMILEGIFRGIRFDRVIFLLVNPQRTWITGRFGLGDGVDDLLPVLHLPLKANGNAFALAMEETREYLVNPRQRSGDRSLMEDKFWQVSGSQTFLAVPLHVDQIPIGAFFVDRIDATRPISEEDQRRLRMFRDLTIIALRLSKKAKIYE